MWRLLFVLCVAFTGPSASAQLESPELDTLDEYDRGRLTAGLLPSGDVFEPLWADPLWPLMAVGFHRYANDDFLENVAAVTIGATIPIYRWENPRNLYFDWIEFAAQGAVQSDFDQDRFSRDNFSNDYIAAVMANARKDRFSAVFRFHHQSSHVGDEYLTNGSGIVREDFGYDRLDFLFSYDVAGQPYVDEAGLFRVYGGFGRALRRPSPPDWGYWHLQSGIELRAPFQLSGYWRPVAAVDVQQQEGNDFKPDINIRAGIQAENRAVHGRTLKFLLEYYNGKEPNGQFWRDDTTILGFGLFITL